MALRMLTKAPQYYLVYFFDDKTMSVVRRERIVKPDDVVLIKGSWTELHIRTCGRNQYKAMLISFGGKQSLYD